MEASTASGVCSQSGIVSTAFAFAAAARKSSTVLTSAAEESELHANSVSETQRSFIKEFDIRVERLRSATDLHRISKMAERILMNLCFLCVHLWQAALGNLRHDDSEIFCRLYPDLCCDRSNRTCRDIHGTCRSCLA